MKEYITVNGTTYECSKITTSINNISIYMENQNIASIENTFRTVSGFDILDQDGNLYGKYEYLSFESATVYLNGTVSVSMHIKSELERRLDALEEGQEIQDGAIQELASIAGGEV